MAETKQISSVATIKPVWVLCCDTDGVPSYDYAYGALFFKKETAEAYREEMVAALDLWLTSLQMGEDHDTRIKIIKMLFEDCEPWIESLVDDIGAVFEANEDRESALTRLRENLPILSPEEHKWGVME